MEGNVNEIREDPSVGLRHLTIPSRSPGVFVLLVALQAIELVVQLDAVGASFQLLFD